MPWVSVVIPIGPKHKHIFTEALDSLEAQTFRQWEAVVVNDTGEQLNLMGYPYVTLVETPGGKGAGYARNRGTEAAIAPFIIYLDADDFLQPDCLHDMLSMRLETGYWVYSDIYSLHPDGTVRPYQVDDFSAEALFKDGLGAVSALISKYEWEQVGGFDEEMESREDWDFQFRLVKAGFCGIRLPRALMTYRLATGGRREGQYKKMVEILREKYPLEELQMGCTGCKKRRTVVQMPAKWTSKEDAGFVQVRYIGKNKSTTTFQGVTGRRYRFGNNDDARGNWVHPQDAEAFIKRGIFEIADILTRSEPQALVSAPGVA